MDAIKNNKDYVIIDSAITDTIRMKDVRVGEELQGIVFCDQTFPSKGTMQPVTNPEYFLVDAIKAINKIFPHCPNLVIKLLKSARGDPAQVNHSDFAPDDSNTASITDLKSYHYSAIISIQDDTRLLIGESRIEAHIPKYSMIFLEVMSYGLHYLMSQTLR